MSSFLGQMNEYKYFSIDRFDGQNLQACTFFLSHCHTDHMIGLDSTDLVHQLLSRKNVKLYVSSVTKVLLSADSKYQALKPFVENLPIEEAKLIETCVDGRIKKVTITLLPAGHCPGSVMFLFEGDEGTSLYTGDFRLPCGSAARMRCLKGKKVDHLYLDTTFCVPAANYIPSRDICWKALENLVENWISKGSNYVVRMNLSAKYGYEYLYEALYNRFQQKIYCARASNYKCIPEVANILTSDPSYAQIYACFKKEKVYSQWKSSDSEDLGNNKKFLFVTLSTLYFTLTALPEDALINMGKNHYRLCFSFHSSLSEVCDFVRHLKPTTLHANVIPNPAESFETVEKRLRELCFVKIKNKESKNTFIEKDKFEPLGDLSSFFVERKSNNCVEIPKKRKVLFDDSSSDDDFSFVVKSRKQK